MIFSSVVLSCPCGLVTLRLLIQARGHGYGADMVGAFTVGGCVAGIMVYGGCVTRDTFEYLGEGFTLTGYVARQSLISAASPPTELVKAPANGKGFEHRSLHGDLTSSLYSALRSRADQTDLFVFDLLSERLGIRELADKSRVTYAPELKRSGILADLPKRPRAITFGTQEHFTLWKAAARKFVGILEATGLLDRTIMVETPWCEYTDTRNPVKPWNNIPAAEADRMYLPYFAEMRSLGVQSCRLPDELAVSSDTHKWNPDPYHYADPAYHWIGDRIRERIPQRN